MRISDWSSDVCSSDLVAPAPQRYQARQGALRLLVVGGSLGAAALNNIVPKALGQLSVAERPIVTHQAGEKHLASLRAEYEKNGVHAVCHADRKSVVKGKSVSVRVDLGGRRIIKKKNKR